ncbi:hypothetical protein [Taibaiella koreensis]|uniref:hypothetical protein n=1 Tax=Taibaiella koreensis TaxID=1268548 RepID=UPI000E59B6D3|nr:hypothetical protein [Taibaiella koreensis]
MRHQIHVMTPVRQSYAELPLLKEHRYHFFFGNEYSIELYERLKEEACLHQCHYIGVLEMPGIYFYKPERCGLLLDVVPYGPEPAMHAIAYLDRLEAELWTLWQEGIFYLAGKEEAAAAFEQALLLRGIAPEQIVHVC